MTTMNYPANYTAIAADEMVYLNGGTTILQTIVDTMSDIDDWIGFVEYPVLTVLYAARTVQYINGEREVSGLASLGTAINNFGRIFYYGGYALNSWATQLNLG